MRIQCAVLLSSASLLLASTSVSAQGPLTLSGAQLDDVLPTYAYDPSRYPVRVAIEPVTIADPDRAREALLMAEDPEANMAAQQMPAAEPQCTPARRALLAAAGRSESSEWDAASQQAPAVASAAAPIRSSVNRTNSRLAAASAVPSVVDDSTPPVQTGVSSSRPVASDVGAGRRTSGANVASDASRRAPISEVASRAPKVEAPIRTARSDKPSRPSGAGAVRSGRGADAADIVARVKSDVNRTLSALPGGSFRLN